MSNEILTETVVQKDEYVGWLEQYDITRDDHRQRFNKELICSHCKNDESFY